MRSTDYAQLSGCLTQDEIDEIYQDRPTVDQDGEISEPYRYIPLRDLLDADSDTVRGYIEYVRETYGVNNAELARTYGISRQLLVQYLRKLGAPMLTRKQGAQIARGYSAAAWARFVSGSPTGPLPPPRVRQIIPTTLVLDHASPELLDSIAASLRSSCKRTTITITIKEDD